MVDHYVSLDIRLDSVRSVMFVCLFLYLFYQIYGE